MFVSEGVTGTFLKIDRKQGVYPPQVSVWSVDGNFDRTNLGIR